MTIFWLCPVPGTYQDGTRRFYVIEGGTVGELPGRTLGEQTDYLTQHSTYYKSEAELIEAHPKLNGLKLEEMDITELM